MYVFNTVSLDMPPSNESLVEITMTTKNNTTRPSLPVAVPTTPSVLPTLPVAPVPPAKDAVKKTASKTAKKAESLPVGPTIDVAPLLARLETLTNDYKDSASLISVLTTRIDYLEKQQTVVERLFEGYANVIATLQAALLSGPTIQAANNIMSDNDEIVSVPTPAPVPVPPAPYDASFDPSSAFGVVLTDTARKVIANYAAGVWNESIAKAVQARLDALTEKGKALPTYSDWRVYLKSTENNTLKVAREAADIRFDACVKMLHEEVLRINNA